MPTSRTISQGGRRQAMPTTGQDRRCRQTGRSGQDGEADKPRKISPRPTTPTSRRPGQDGQRPESRCGEGRPGPEAKPTAQDTGKHADEAAQDLAKAAEEVRKEAAEGRRELAKLSQEQSDKLADLKQKVDNELAKAMDPTTDRLNALAQAEKKVDEALQHQAQADQAAEKPRGG